MDFICNKLEKLRPPNFVTVKAENQGAKKSVMLKWTKLSSTLFIQKKQAEIFTSESEILGGFLARKEVQLRREKAQLLTRRVFKLTTHWKANDFLGQLKNFQTAMGRYSKTTVHLIVQHSKATRLPSSQWCCWIIYLALREAAILAKIKLELENATKFWLGLIASSHHWGDSLVVTGILSRLWHLSSVQVENLIEKIYPSLISMLDLMDQTASSKWPAEDWVVPRDLKAWLNDNMNLPFEPTNMGRNYPVKEKQENQTSSLLSKMFERKSIKTKASKVKKNPSTEKFFRPAPIKFGKTEEEEDFGIPVDVIEKPKAKKRKLKRQLDVTAKAVKNFRQESSQTDWKTFKKHWKIFFKNYEQKLNSSAGRKVLLVRIKKYNLQETDNGLQMRLIKLRKSIRKSTDDNIVALVPFQKFETFIKKQTNRMKISLLS